MLAEPSQELYSAPLSLHLSPTCDPIGRTSPLLFGAQADAADPHGSPDLVVELHAHSPSHLYEQQMGVLASRKIGVFFRPTSRTKKILCSCQGIARMVRIADLKFRPAIGTDAFCAHMAGELILRIRTHEYVLEHMAVVEIVRSVERDSQGAASTKSACSVQTDKRPLCLDDMPIESPIEDFELEGPVCNEVRTRIGTRHFLWKSLPQGGPCSLKLREFPVLHESVEIRHGLLDLKRSILLEDLAPS